MAPEVYRWAMNTKSDKRALGQIGLNIDYWSIRACLATLSEYIVYTRLWLSWWRHQMETFCVLLALYEGNHWWPVASSYKGQWCRTLMFSLICAWTSGWANSQDTGDLRCHCAHYDITLIWKYISSLFWYNATKNRFCPLIHCILFSLYANR